MSENYIPISNAKGTLVINALTVIYATPGGKIAKIKNVKFAPNDFTLPYTIYFYILYQSGAEQSLVYKKRLEAGDSVDDTTVYLLSDDMKLAAMVDIDGVIEYSVTGKEIIPQQ